VKSFLHLFLWGQKKIKSNPFLRSFTEDFGVTTEFVELVSGGKTPVAYVFITAGSGARSIIYERNTLPKIKIDATPEKAGRSNRCCAAGPGGHLPWGAVKEDSRKQCQGYL
jgi:hypothetical protein